MEPLVHFIRTGATAGLARNREEEWALIESGKRNTKILRDARRSREAADKSQQFLEPFPVQQSDLDGIELLSLDVWDTILRRDCYPDEIKLQSARYVYLSCFWDIRPAYRSLLALLRRRIQVENEAAPKRDFEYRFSMAAERWLRDVLEPAIPAERVYRLRDAVLEHEFQAEKRSTRIDPAFKLFREKTQLPQTIFTSDFYLESTVIMRLLASHGAGCTFVKGYSSCDEYMNKRSGELFHKIMQEFSISPSAILHIGDNPIADIAVPQRLGIRSISYLQPAEQEQQEVQKRAYEGFLNGKQELHHEALDRVIEELAATVCDKADSSALTEEGVRLAPIAAGFIMHVIETALRFDVGKIYFFTREGQFLKELYEQIVSLDPYSLGVDTYPIPRLLEVSRLATFAASLRSVGTQELMRLWNQYSKQSLRAFCNSLNFDAVTVISAAQRQGLDLDEVVDMPWNDPRFCAVLENPEVQNALQGHLEDQKRNLTAYLEQEGFLDDAQTALIVDIGWRGTIQDNLCYLTKKHVHGCYLGLFKFLNDQPSNSGKDGWLANYNKYEYCWDGEDIAPLEMLFNGLGGSVVGYEQSTSGVQAQRQIIEGEEAVVENYIRPLQAGIIQGSKEVCDYIRLHGLLSADIRSFARSKAREFLNAPPSSIARAFFELKHNESFGTGETTDMTTVADLARKCEGLADHRLHAATSRFLEKSHWKAGLLALEPVRSFYEALSPQDRRALPMDFGLHYRGALIGRHGPTPRMAIYVPSPLIGSGGHRTIFNVARHVQKMGIELFIYLESEGAGVGCVEEYLQGTPAHVFVGWDRAVPVDFALATIAHSAAYVAEHPCPFKGYLVQDFEAGFNPLSDGYVSAENSYCYGLQHFTIGNWLAHLLRTQFGVDAVPAGLGVDTDVYRPLSGVVRENAVCFLYQPDKPRRAPVLGINALRRLKHARPDTKVYVYGSDLPLENVDFEVENLGLIQNLREINMLYNRCKVGLCISMSNPSRIPYEMMAAGTIPVDLYRYNNLLDHKDGTAILAFQSDASLAEAMLNVLENEIDCLERSQTCIYSTQSRSLLWEQDVIGNAISEILQKGHPTGHNIQLLYEDSAVIAAEEKIPSVTSFCRWQKYLSCHPSDRNI
ncbi:hypothetical protein AUP43_14850 [Oceanibaculum pacificum]|uniref:WsaF C-terminal domain-containing protein n=2 Tax=Oceanibaculum pacificum TaxID=580166 RepID=A0A154VAC4_9PROT|nr:hypothetical protein AUP43_14850 [Oceanibaculum pacificum]